jgi:hypothetical protein
MENCLQSGAMSRLAKVKKVAGSQDIFHIADMRLKG